MAILTKAQVDALELKGSSGMSAIYMMDLAKVELGGGVLIKSESWKGKTAGGSYIAGAINARMNKTGNTKRYRSATLSSERGWVVFRIA